jgi:hypothetical protein
MRGSGLELWLLDPYEIMAAFLFLLWLELLPEDSPAGKATTEVPNRKKSHAYMNNMIDVLDRYR